MSEPLFHTSCPSCGAPVHIHSATAVTVVCGYCNSMLVRQDNSLHDTGRDSALLTDFSPLQIGTMGRFNAKGFVLIGRLQAKYEQGVWNEWYARFDDGTHGWLSEAGDIFVFVREMDLQIDLPEFDELIVGETVLQWNKPFVASDVRQITLDNAAAQGELPFRLPELMNNRVADFRCENLFLTLDYATSPPTAFVGRTVQLVNLQLEHFRNPTEIRQSAGSLKGLRHASNCPNCGGSVHWFNALTPTVICQHCGSDLDTSGDTIKLREADAMRKAQDTALSLPIGKQGKIRGKTYTVIGAVRKEELSSTDAYSLIYDKLNYAVPQGWWVEYLLYSPNDGFLWLVETPDDGGTWHISETMTEFPRLNEHLQPQGARKLYAYGGRVSYAAGAFYWHIRAGDVNHYTDYGQGGTKICAELSKHELAWSKSVRMMRHEREAFGIATKNSYYSATSDELTEIATNTTRMGAIGIFCLINAPAWLMMSGDDLFFSAFMSFIILLILWTAGRNDDDE